MKKNFDLFWGSRIVLGLNILDFLKKKKKKKNGYRKGFDDGISKHEYHSEPKTYHHQQYYEALDVFIGCIKDTLGSISLGALFIATSRTCC